MHKFVMIFSLMLSMFNYDYVTIKSIECYKQYNKKIEFVFNFESDYLNSHEIMVKIDLFHLNNQPIGSFSNSLNIIGNKAATANIDYLYSENIYAHISALYKGEKLIDNIRFDFLKNDSCDLNKENRNCNSFYKVSYKAGVIKEYDMNMKIVSFPFDKFLSYNRLKLDDISIYSEYDFSLSNVYILLHEKIDDYDLFYDGKYMFLLDVIKKENSYSFTLLDDHYLSIDKHTFTDKYNDTYIRVNDIYLPFYDEYKEYNMTLVIDGNSLITIDFSVAISDFLMGECNKSKYCVERR